MPSKSQLYAFCEAYIEDRLSRIQKNIGDVQHSLTAETKSSAGDKHETGRAMLQLEREKLGSQLAEAENQRRLLLRVPVKGSSEKITLGTRIKTSQHEYYLAISAGCCKVGDSEVFCISPGSPIGRLLMGKSKGDTLEFQGNKIKIVDLE